MKDSIRLGCLLLTKYVKGTRDLASLICQLQQTYGEDQDKVYVLTGSSETFLLNRLLTWPRIVNVLN